MFLNELTRFLSPEPAGGGGITLTVTPAENPSGADDPDDSIDTVDFGLTELESGAPDENLKELNRVIRQEQAKDPDLQPFEREESREPEQDPTPDIQPKSDVKPDTVGELTNTEMQQLRTLGKKMMAKMGKLSQYVPTGDVVEALTRYNGGLEMFERARALAGRAGISVPELFDYVEQGVTGAQRNQAGNRPADPDLKPAKLDRDTLDKISALLGLTPDESESTVELLRQALGTSGGDPTLADRLARLEHGQNLTREQQNQSFWSTEFSEFTKSNPKVESLKDKLDFVLTKEESRTPGFCQSLLDESIVTGVRPYQWALRYYMASFSSPEEFMQSIGAVKSRVDAPVSAQRVVGAGHLGQGSPDNENFDPDKATDEELNTFLSHATGSKFPKIGSRFR
jgi:hypothetical protein